MAKQWADIRPGLKNVDLPLYPKTFPIATAVDDRSVLSDESGSIALGGEIGDS